MSHPTGTLSTEACVDGLRRNDEAVLSAIYADYRPAFIKAIAAAGGSEATGRAFFRTALVEARQLDLPVEMPFFAALKALGLAHYRDWLTEREQPLPETEPDPEEPDATSVVPAPEALRDTRTRIEAWKRGEQTDHESYLFWEKIRRIEHQIDEPLPPKPKSNLARNLFIVFGVLTLGWLAWTFLFPSKTPAEVYDDNFTMPKSLIEDMRARYGPEMGNDSVSSRPSACQFYLTEADQFYRVKDYESAQAVLFGILEDSLTLCHSDALFYIGVIALEQEKPELALECFSKIEDLEHFGEDIYWYQALAFVKIAEFNPLFRDKATRAVERNLSNTRDSLRRIQAEKMLQHLSR